jgi:SAM-dependent methyltransferase
VGCGTGRLLADALARGADVIGVDLSQHSLKVCRNKIGPDQAHRVQRMDVRRLDLDRRDFQLALAPFRVFSHLVAIQDQLTALERIAAHLAPGGRLVFDLFVPADAIGDGLPPTIDWEGEWRPGCGLRRSVTTRVQRLDQIIEVTMVFEWREPGADEDLPDRPRAVPEPRQSWRDSCPITNHDLPHHLPRRLPRQDDPLPPGWHRGIWTFPMRFFHRFEIEHLLARSPLILERIDGDFAGGALSNDSREFVVHCRRPQ